MPRLDAGHHCLAMNVHSRQPASEKVIAAAAAAVAAVPLLSAAAAVVVSYHQHLVRESSLHSAWRVNQSLPVPRLHPETMMTVATPLTLQAQCRWNCGGQYALPSRQAIASIQPGAQAAASNAPTKPTRRQRLVTSNG